MRALILLACALGPDDAPVLEHDVLPILAKRCMGCHGGLKKKGDLDLRTLESMLKGGDEGPAVVSGKPDKSLLWTQVASDEMPKGGEKLSASEKETLRRWIAAGLPTFAGHDDPLLKPKGRHEPAEVAAAIDGHVDRQLKAAGLEPAPVADDEAFLRRVTLDLTGRVPTPEQAAAFLDDSAKDKRAKLVDRLLASKEFGVHLGRTWRDWIAPPELPSDMNSGKQPIKETHALGEWFAKRFNDGAPWDVIVREILTVKGEIKNHPQVIFYGLAGQNAKATPDGSARSIASLFLGVQIQCAQCHDDPYRTWAQTDFWSLAAFFGNVSGDFKKIDEKSGRGEMAIPKSAFKNAGTQVPVAFLDGSKTDPKKSAAWRSVLADWVTSPKNPWFSRAYVNRAWFQLFARGLVNPVDDLRPLNPPSHPGLLKLLEAEFAASKFDVRHLLRCITASKAYQRSAAVDPKLDVARRTAQRELFGRAPVRVMTADMLLESLKRAYGDDTLDLRPRIAKDDGNTNGESAALGDPYLEFHRVFGTNEEDATDFTHGIPQMLTFINHPRLRERNRALEEHLEKHKDATPQEIVERLYLATLSRRPSNAERSAAVEYVKGANEPMQGYLDVLWVLVNRTEYLCIR